MNIHVYVIHQYILHISVTASHTNKLSNSHSVNHTDSDTSKYPASYMYYDVTIPKYMSYNECNEESQLQEVNYIMYGIK